MVTDLRDQRNMDSKPEGTQQIKSKLISTAESKKISGTRDTNDLQMQKCRNETSRGTVDRNLPANAGDTGLIPGLGRFHRPWATKAWVPQQLSLHSRAHEPQQMCPRAATAEAHALQQRPRATKKQTVKLKNLKIMTVLA